MFDKLAFSIEHHDDLLVEQDKGQHLHQLLPEQGQLCA